MDKALMKNKHEKHHLIDKEAMRRDLEKAAEERQQQTAVNETPTPPPAPHRSGDVT